MGVDGIDDSPNPEKITDDELNSVIHDILRAGYPVHQQKLSDQLEHVHRHANLVKSGKKASLFRLKTALPVLEKEYENVPGLSSEIKKFRGLVEKYIS